jgi:DNA replicative helicase MCM subunit Mcm2 (Cdc46/Mcm family)
MGEIVSLTAKLKAMCDSISDRDVLNPQLLKKYISYARHTVFPKLSMEACEIIKNFYISLRENAVNNSNTLPITSRALDSLIRLSQARAKLELRAIVSREDAITVVKLI